MKREFLEQRAERYRRRDHLVWGLLPGLRPAPEGWVGPPADLYVEKGDFRMAKLVRTEAELRSPRALDNLRAVLQNPGVRVRLFVFSRRSLGAARSLRRRLRWSARRRVEVVPVRRSRSRAPSWGVFGSYRRHRLEWGVGLTAILVVALLGVKAYFFPGTIPRYVGLEEDFLAEERDPLLSRIKDLERRLERQQDAGWRPADSWRGLWQGMTAERAPDLGAAIEQEFQRSREAEARAAEELRRRAARDQNLQREAHRLRDLEERVQEELRKRGIAVEELKKRGLLQEQDLRRLEQAESQGLGALGRSSGQGQDAQQELRRLKELEERALEEMRRRGITFDDLRKRGVIP